MLVRFGVENYKSFKDMTYLELISGPQTKMKQFLMENPYNKVLKFIALYGANASGKSNLIDAMYFSRRIILTGSEGLSTMLRNFKGNKSYDESSFSYHIVVKEKYYVYNISVDMPKREISSEELLIFDDQISQYQEIYKRNNQSIEINNVVFSSEIDRINIYRNDFVKNQSSKYSSFLKDLQSKDLKETNLAFLIDIYLWFFKMIIVKDDNHYSRESLLDFSCKNDDYFLKHQSKLLHDFDTGIDDINMVDVSLDELEKIESKFFVEQCLSEFQKNSDKQEIYIRRSYKSENVYAFINKNNQLVVKKMLYKHLGESYDFFEESTGTKKIIDLYDIFLSIDRTVIIDEIDRSFHHNLTVEFINKFLSTSKNSQLIVTTHDPLLMDLQLFRRDSFWFVERCSDNSSSLYPLEKFKPRFDKIVYKDYLAGRYNAIPCLSGNEDD